MVDVIVVGAGAAGLSAAVHLKQAGLAVTVLEASASDMGGRIRKGNIGNNSVDLGAQFIHGLPEDILNPLVDFDAARGLADKIQPFDMPWSIWNGEEFYTESLPTNDHRWVNYTWYDFFADHVASKLSEDEIVLGCEVTTVQRGTLSNDNVVATCKGGETMYTAPFIVITVSMQLLQNEAINFTPPLPESIQRAIGEYAMAPAVKVFLEFSGEQFFPDAWEIEQDYRDYSLSLSSPNHGQRVFYNEALGQAESTNRQLVGLFSYGAIAQLYSDAPNDEAVVDRVMILLESMFGSDIRGRLVASVVQVWSKEPFVQTGYTQWVRSSSRGGYAPDVLRDNPVDSQLYFAGEAITGTDYEWGFVHGAALSGIRAAQQILDNKSNASSSNADGFMSSVFTFLATLASFL